MRVLHLISSGGLYGAEAVILQLSQVLNRAHSMNSQIGVFAHAGQPVPALFSAAEAAGVPAHLVPCRGQIDMHACKRLRELADRTGADVIHAHGYKADIYAYLSFRGRDRPALVSTCHTWYDNDWAVRLYGAADRWVLRSFEEVVAVSAEVQQRLLEAGVAPDRTHLVRNGVEVNVEQPLRPTGAGKGSPRPLRVGLVGRLAREKGIDIFLNAAALLKQQLPAVNFVVAGEGPDRSALEALRGRLALDKYVQLPGQQADMPRFYQSLDILVSASRQEGLPMALLEGMRAGLPIVATRVGEVPQVVQSGETGFLVPPEDPAALAEAIRHLLQDEALRASFGVAGRHRLTTEFSAERMTAQCSEVYRRATARRGRALTERPDSEGQ